MEHNKAVILRLRALRYCQPYIYNMDPEFLSHENEANKTITRAVFDAVRRLPADADVGSVIGAIDSFTEGLLKFHKATYLTWERDKVEEKEQ